MAADLATRRAARTPTARPARTLGIRLHQVITTQAAAALVLVGAVVGGPTFLLTAVGAALLLTLTWLRTGERWAFEWIVAALRFGIRRRAAATVLDLAAPGTQMTSADLPGGPGAMLADDFGLTMLLELGDPVGVLVEAQPELAAPWELLPADGRERPPCRVQLLLAGAPAPAITAGDGPVGISYRSLAGGPVLGHARAVLAVRVLRAEGWADEDLRGALTGLVRKLAKRLNARPLDRAAAVRTLTDLAYADPPAAVREEWTRLRAGELSQVTFQARPEAGAAPSAESMTRLLLLPVAATTVALTADLPGPESTDRPLISLSIRLTAPDPALLEMATGALHTLAAGERLRLRRRDGEHLQGLAATLPLGTSGDPPRAGPDWPHGPSRWPSGHHGTSASGSAAGPQGSSRRRLSPTERFGRLVLPTGRAGVVVGRDRHGRPLQVRLFRPEPTQVMLVGGLQCAQLLAFRALAVGARVLVRTRRPQEWVPFARGTAAASDSILLAPPGHSVEMPPGAPLRPLLTVLDLRRAAGPSPGPITAQPSGVYDVRPRTNGGIGPAPTRQEVTASIGRAAPGDRSGDGSGNASRTGNGSGNGNGSRTGNGNGNGREGRPWEATLTLRDEFRARDVATAVKADLVLLQPTGADQAELIGTTLNLGEVGRLLTRMRPGMIGVVNRQAVRWATLSPTPVEKVLIGDPSRSIGAQ
ncbi:type VII secretion protein EccE [Actinoplanes regularis]|uniref:Type VII secretion protein EccE n=1 Tax=Actinoplanes regularis TaxID=52697 RepID=A0A239CD02_9ACTN|nr:type VII secretion protein EccE [Actinoplanes regularis]